MPAKNKIRITFSLKTSNPGKPVYLAGNFNGWTPNLREFRLSDAGNDRQEITLFLKYPEQFPLEYKYTCGSWELDERDNGGERTENRRVEYPVPLIEDVVPVWPISPEKKWPFHETFSNEFKMQTLRRKRRIAVLLPNDYFRQKEKRYPVLYLLDGQNLSGHGSSYGNWELDKRLRKLGTKGFAEVIVVMIDHGGKNRISEFSPYPHRKAAQPKADYFLRFLTDFLKPAIDASYRTEPGRDCTGIGGSSMGGLFSVYAGLRRPDIFGKIMVFSPSLWIAAPLFGDIDAHFYPFPARLYLYAGGREGVRTISDLQKLQHLIQAKDPENKLKIHFSLDPRGRHREERWGAEFEKALPWLFFSTI